MAHSKHERRHAPKGFTPSSGRFRKLKRNGDRLVNKICDLIRNCPAGMPVVIEAPKEIPLPMIKAVIQKAIETTESESITIHGLIVDVA